MLKQEFEKMVGVEIDGRVYDIIELDYRNSNHDKQDWFKKFGRNGVVRSYAEELKDRNQKLANLARKAIETYDRCHSSEFMDDNGRVMARSFDLWYRLMTIWSTACDALGIDEYAEDARDQMLTQYVIV